MNEWVRPSTAPLWRIGAVVIGSFAVLSAASAAGALALAKGAGAARR